MKVVLVNHSDTKGGASVAAVRLMYALRQAGVDARMLVMHKTLNDDNIALVSTKLARRTSFLLEHAQIFARNGFSKENLFKVSIATTTLPIHRHPWVKQADVVVLHWVNQGMMSLKEVRRIKAPVVWTMHDMWNLTGVCHHAGECIGYMRECGHCRLLNNGRDANDLSRSTYLRKLYLYDHKPIYFVAVSNWLARRCAKSLLMKGRSLSVIPNAFPVADFTGVPKLSRKACGLPEDKRLIIMGAARLDDPIKGFDIAITALNKVRDMPVAAVFFGDLRDKKVLDRLRLPYVWLGPVNSPSIIRDIYAHSDCVLSTSHYETLPTTIIEGMAAGCVPVTFGYGGQQDIVDHKQTGYIAIYRNADDVANGIRYAMSGAVDRDLMRRTVAERFAAESVAQKYIDLFNQIITTHI